ncbi:MAG: hypothetical protein HY748_17765 [Elusimicrobia bacterium]|nr:hypothetical protein [Elusimicrobiota bacterium]
MNAILLLLSLPVASMGQAQEISFEFHAATTARLGVPMKVEAVVRSAPGLELFCDLEASTTDSYSITKARITRSGAVEPGGSAGPLAERAFDLELLPLDIGEIPVRVFWTVQGRAPSGLRRVESPAFTVEVPEPDLGENPQLKDIKEVRSARSALWPWLLLAALAAAGYCLWKRRKTAGPAAAPDAAPPDTRPAHVIAQSELDWLERSGLWEEGRYKEFYIRLTDTLRQYLERRYGLPAMQLTTTELVSGMRAMEVERRLGQAVKDLLDRADLAKFARWRPETGQGAQEIHAAREIVQASAPKDLAPQPAQAAAP